MSGSAAAIVELSRRKSRYNDQDLLLKAYIGNDGKTAKEIAALILGWNYEPYSNSPKRAYDLLSLGYLEEMPARVCTFTGFNARTFKITEKGLEHLRGLGLDLAPLRTAKTEAIAPSQAGGETVEASVYISNLRDLIGG